MGPARPLQPRISLFIAANKRTRVKTSTTIITTQIRRWNVKYNTMRMIATLRLAGKSHTELPLMLPWRV